MKPTAYTALRQQLDAAYTLATYLASEVHKQQLTQVLASERLTQAYPQLAAATLGSPLPHNFIGTR